METSRLETDNICSNDYAAVGLKNSRKDSSGHPRILSLLGTLLEKSVQKNERLLETSQTKDVITIFHGLRAPAVSVQQYIDRIFKYSCCSPSCFVISHIYMERFIQRTNLFLTSLNIHRLLITSVLVAVKFMDDSYNMNTILLTIVEGTQPIRKHYLHLLRSELFFNNAYYARVGGVSTSEINKLETKFLFALDFRLYVSAHTFGKYCSVFKREAVGDLIECPIKACGVEKNWANKDDPVHAQSIAR